MATGHKGGLMNYKRMKLFLAILTVIIITWGVPALTENIPQAMSDKGLVVFYRLSSFKGGAIRFNLNHSEGFIGQLLSGTVL